METMAKDNNFECFGLSDDYGIQVKDATVNFPGMIERSRDVATGMSKGVQFLFKKNKIDIIDGFGKLKPGKKVEVEALITRLKNNNGDERISEQSV